ncbi:MAG: metal ABC transporter permease [bacterium]
MYDFIWQAFLAGLALVLVSGVLGSLIIWRRMAYFGDTLSHSALLGVSMGFVLGINLSLSTLFICLFIALIMLWIQRQKQLGQDTLLGILAHASLAWGMLALSFLEGVRVDLMAYLFGDILAVSPTQLWIIWGLTLLILLSLIWLWRPLLALAVDESLARVEGVPVGLVSVIYLLLLALLVAIAMHIVGMLFMTAMLIIPAAAARPFARTPEQMVLLASLMGLIALSAGLIISLQWDTPTGPSIVASATVLFTLSLLKERTL